MAWKRSDLPLRGAPKPCCQGCWPCALAVRRACRRLFFPSPRRFLLFAPLSGWHALSLALRRPQSLVLVRPFLFPFLCAESMTSCPHVVPTVHIVRSCAP